MSPPGCLLRFAAGALAGAREWRKRKERRHYIRACDPRAACCTCARPPPLFLLASYRGQLCKGRKSRHIHGTFSRLYEIMRWARERMYAFTMQFISLDRRPLWRTLLAACISGEPPYTGRAGDLSTPARTGLIPEGETCNYGRASVFGCHDRPLCSAEQTGQCRPATFTPSICMAHMSRKTAHACLYVRDTNSNIFPCFLLQMGCSPSRPDHVVNVVPRQVEEVKAPMPPVPPPPQPAPGSKVWPVRQT